MYMKVPKDTDIANRRPSTRMIRSDITKWVTKRKSINTEEQEKDMTVDDRRKSFRKALFLQQGAMKNNEKKMKIKIDKGRRWMKSLEPLNPDLPIRPKSKHFVRKISSSIEKYEIDIK